MGNTTRKVLVPQLLNAATSIQPWSTISANAALQVERSPMFLHELALTIIVMSDPHTEGIDVVERSTESLIRELKDAEVRAELVHAAHPAPPGAKSGGCYEIGKLLLTVAPSVLPKLLDLLQSFVNRRMGRKVVLKLANGRELTFDENVKPEVLKTFLSGTD